MSYEATARCHFCGGLYYLHKLVAHERICASRPRGLTIERAVRIAIDTHPEASKNGALLIRLVWMIRDGYYTEPPRERLTEPGSIMSRALLLCRKMGRPPPPDWR
ncbi:MAG: hypothetical protein JRM82_02605 [Nitrososphaerota archaeon]|nr:hypothetical protein [Nitrososphaerota archaeon]